jgi:hypothetical protein
MAFSLCGISLSANAGQLLERVNNGPGTEYVLNTYNLSSRINVYQLSGADAFSRWNLPVAGVSGKISVDANTGYCLKPSYIGNNSPIYLTPCAQATNFIKEYVYNGPANDVRLRVAGSNFCINTPNVNLFNGGYTFLYQCASTLAGDTEQIWRLR